ncbi:MAG: cadherin-like beta sandwich domain-containing protein [Verrucomicrobia bacterium]|nr:cadherin-like beta sandwich domain-containing protein [Verrucomicrobiota bacterium]
MISSKLFLALFVTLPVFLHSARAAVVNATYSSAGDVPVTAAAYSATGNTVVFTLNYAPAIGANLWVVKNTGPGFIQGSFDNLAQGQIVGLTYQGIPYRYVANYYGGTGNDLVLQWANTRPVSWGDNSYGQLGNNTFTQSSIPVAVSTAGVLAGKTVVAVAAGYYHSLALCSDGTVAAWGYNNWGQLGNASTTQSSNHPLAVNTAGVLSGKPVVAVAAGGYHSLALCSDGTVAAWGFNSNGQLGNNSTTNSLVPVAVNTAGVLSGKTVVAIAAGGSFASSHSLALCSDGTLTSWGDNNYGQLGNNSNVQSKVPVAVSTAGVLADKTVVAVAASGAYGSAHSLALCSNGTLAAWGYNAYGQLGNGSVTDSPVPVAVNAAGVLSGKMVIAVAAGYNLSLALCSDGTLASWGDNGYGQLGNNTTTESAVPVAVSMATLAVGERFVTGVSGVYAQHSLAIVASPLWPAVTTLTTSSMTASSVTLNGSVYANGYSTTASFEYGLTLSYGTVVSVPGTITGTSTTSVSADLTGLTPGATYHYRAIGTTAAGVSKGEDMTFTTLRTDANLLYLELSTGTLNPVFAPAVKNYTAGVSTSATTMRVTPTTLDGAATVAVNGVAGASGIPSQTISLSGGVATITVVVTAQDGITTKTYTVKVMPDTSPPVIFVPANITIDAVTPEGAEVIFMSFAIDSLSGFVPTTDIPPSGTIFPIGTTTVTSTASDPLGNTASKTFTVTVTKPPFFAQDLVGPRIEISGGYVKVTVKSAVSGRAYQLQGSNDLLHDSWADLGPPQVGNGSDLVISVPYSPAVHHRFFRLKLN